YQRSSKRAAYQPNKALTSCFSCSSSTTGDRRDNRDLCFRTYISLETIEKSNILSIDVDVYEAAELAVRFAEPIANAGEICFKLVENISDGRRVYLDGVNAIGEPAQGGRNNYFLCHMSVPFPLLETRPHGLRGVCRSRLQNPKVL